MAYDISEALWHILVWKSTVEMSQEAWLRSIISARCSIWRRANLERVWPT